MNKNVLILGRLFGLLVGCILGAGTASAALYTFDLTGNVASGSGMTSTQCGAVACKETFNLGNGYQLTAVAYSTPTNYAPNGYSTSANSVAGYTGCSATTGCGADGNFMAAKIALYSGGIGISNLVETALQDSNDTTVPQHAIDNNGAIDMVVFSLQKLIGSTWVNQQFDPNTFQLGYAAVDSDVQAFLGGNGLAADYDFRNACFQGCTGAAQPLTGTPGFTEITSNIPAVTGGVASPGGASAAAGVNVPTGTDVSFGTTTTGQYLVMSGSLGNGSITGGNDFFKISSLSVKVPTPGSVALFALGLVALSFTRARRYAPARI